MCWWYPQDSEGHSEHLDSNLLYVCRYNDYCYDGEMTISRADVPRM